MVCLVQIYLQHDQCAKMESNGRVNVTKTNSYCPEKATFTVFEGQREKNNTTYAIAGQTAPSKPKPARLSNETDPPKKHEHTRPSRTTNPHYIASDEA